MFFSDLRLAHRYLYKHKGISMLNLTGLAAGMAACLLIALYVHDEQSYDRFHEHADRVFRVSLEVANQGQLEHYAVSVPALGPTLQAEFPEIEAFVRLAPAGGTIRRGAMLLRPDQLYHADSSFFEVFSFPLVRGNAETALSRPYTLVLSETMAQRLFNDEEPLGQTLMVAGLDCEVTGIFKDPPPNSHIQPKVVLSMTTLTARIARFNDNNWWMRGTYTYLMLRQPSDAAAVAQKLGVFTETHFADVAQRWDATFRLHLQPVTDIHLTSHLLQEARPNGSKVQVYTFSAVAVLVLVMACINFINLRTARSVQRAREVGIRKVAGALPHQLVRQFLTESLAISVLALVLALGMVSVALPFFNTLTEKTMTLGVLLEPVTVMMAVGLVGSVGLLAGAYPAFFLASFQPAQVLKGRYIAHQRGQLLRKGLVVLQFAIALMLLVATTVILKQLAYTQHIDLGYERAQRIVLPNHPAMRRTVAPETVKQTLLQHPNIEQLAAGTYVPTHMLPGNMTVVPDGRQDPFGVTVNTIDEDYVPTLGLTLIAGRNLSATRASDSTAFLVNEAAADLFGWPDPIGHTLRPSNNPSGKGEVIGVIQNFHTGSLHALVEPVVLRLGDARQLRRYIVHVAPERLDETLAFLQEQWMRFAPDEPFEYTFLEAEYAALYQSEEQLAHVTNLFSALALLISALGLLGSMAFAVTQRTKEIGVRKVLGASLASLIALLTRDFVKLLAIAFVLAMPLAYLVMEQWLQAFAYRVHIGAGTFVLAGVAALGVALLTVSYQAIKAARTNPIDALRYE